LAQEKSHFYGKGLLPKTTKDCYPNIESPSLFTSKKSFLVGGEERIPHETERLIPSAGKLASTKRYSRRLAHRHEGGGALTHLRRKAERLGPIWG